METKNLNQEFNLTNNPQIKYGYKEKVIIKTGFFKGLMGIIEEVKTLDDIEETSDFLLDQNKKLDTKELYSNNDQGIVYLINLINYQKNTYVAQGNIRRLGFIDNIKIKLNNLGNKK